MASSKKLSDQDRTLELNIPEQLTKSKITRPNLEAVPTDLSSSATPVSLEKTKSDLNLESLGLNEDDVTIVKPLKIQVAATPAPTRIPDPIIRPEIKIQVPVQPKAAIPQPVQPQQPSVKNDELRKIAQVLLQEAKKVPQFSQEMKSEIDKLREEIQSLPRLVGQVEDLQPEFIDGIKQTQQLIQEFKQSIGSMKSQDQNLEQNINALNELVKECTHNLKSEYQKVADDMQDLQHKKSKLNSSLLELQNQHDLKVASIKVLEDQRADMTRKADLLKDDVYYKEHKARELEEKNLRLKEALSILPSLEHEITDQRLQKEKLTLEMNSLIHTVRHNESKISMLEEQYHQRKSALENLERSIGEAHKQIESLKQTELGLIHTCAEEKAKLLQLRSESMVIETQLLSQQKMREEDTHHYHERKDQVLRELSLAEKKYKARLVEIEDELHKKHKDWEEQIQREAELKEMQLKSSLQIIRQSHMHEWDKKHSSLVDRLCSVMKKSAPESELKQEVDQILHDFFSSHQKSWKL